MEQQYPVTLGHASVGKVTVDQEGLYCRVRCSCLLPEPGIYRLMAGSGENLGILVPRDGSFVLDRKIPAKQLRTGGTSFFLRPKDAPEKDHFAPIVPEEPFAYISRLKDSFLEARDGQVGITIT